MSAHPGLSGSDPDVLGRVVLKLLKFAEDKVPSSEWKGTKVQLMITAEEDGVGRALEECRKVLRSSGFLFRDDWASVLKGQDEGLYSWLAVNYALGYIGNKPQETAGVIVLGKSAMRVLPFHPLLSRTLLDLSSVSPFTSMLACGSCPFMSM